jgi:hypothetical protein
MQPKPQHPAAADRHADAERQERVHSGWEKNRVRAGRNADNPVRSRSVRTGFVRITISTPAQARELMAEIESEHFCRTAL